MDDSKDLPFQFSWSRQSFVGGAPSARSCHTGSVVGDTLVICGGFGDGVERSDFILVDLVNFDFVVDKTSKIVRIGHTAQVIQNKIYIYGGWNGKKYLNSGCLYSVDKMSMLLEKSKERVLPTARRDHSIALENDRMYLFGGWDCTDQFNDLWILSDTWAWSEASPQGTGPCPRRGHSASAVGASMFIFGGVYGFSRSLDDLYVLDTKSMTWSKPETFGTKPSPRAWHSATVIGKYIIIFGGSASRREFFNDVYILDTETMYWHRAQVDGDPPTGRCSHSAALYGPRIVIFGGITSVDGKITALGDLYFLETGLLLE